MKKKIFLISFVCLAGLLSGGFLKIISVRASSPESGCPVGVEASSSIVYDEVWRPLSALVTAKEAGSGIYKVGAYNFSDGQITFKNNNTQALAGSRAGEATKDGKIVNQPKFKVTRWRVTGHAHFPNL